MTPEEERKLKEMNSEIIALERRLRDLRYNRDQYLNSVSRSDKED